MNDSNKIIKYKNKKITVVSHADENATCENRFNIILPYSLYAYSFIIMFPYSLYAYSFIIMIIHLIMYLFIINRYSLYKFMIIY